MQIVYIASIYPENKKVQFGIAGDSFQKAIISGLRAYTPDIRILSFPLIPYDSGYRKRKEEYSQQAPDRSYFPIPRLRVLSHLLEYFKLKQQLNRYKGIRYPVCFVLSDVHLPFIMAAARLKKHNRHVILCQVAGDLPEYMSESKNLFYRIGKKAEISLINHYLKQVDAGCVLTEAMPAKLLLGKDKYCVLEGIYDESLFRPHVYNPHKSRVILYTGSLDERYGIGNLLNAFQSMDNRDLRLFLCGSGNMENRIKEYCKKDSRIKYLGNLSRTETLKLQQEAYLLVNPRTPEGEYTKYSFPSKTIEYLASGTPTILCKLPGIPEDYYRYCVALENGSTEELKQALVRVLSMEYEDLYRLGQQAQEFILKTKNSRTQAKKLYDLLCHCCDLRNN